MTFKEGDINNPAGRPTGSTGKATRVKNIIFDIFKGQEAAFKSALEKQCKADPISFYFSYVVPFMPKMIELDASVKVEARMVPSKEEIDMRLKELKGKVQRSHAGSKNRGRPKPHQRVIDV
tara:strand:+ start:181 stop:543 length:363 start_codon:yes stop_codon:yes gene_type:complete